jgi:ABC-2 type transport system permease protein
MMVVWLAVVEEVGPAAGWDKSDFISYYLAAVVVDYLTSAWVTWDWDEDIRTGNLSVKLLKPLEPIHHYSTNALGWKLFILVVMLPPLVLLTWFSPSVHYAADVGQWLAAVLAIAAGFLLNLFMNSAFGVIAFWTTQATNLFSLWNGVGQFLSGFIAPLALFPELFRRIAFLLPFRSTLSFPLEIMTGRLTWPEIGFGFAVTLAWTLLFYFLYRLLYRLGLQRYEAVGA